MNAVFATASLRTVVQRTVRPRLPDIDGDGQRDVMTARCIASRSRLLGKDHRGPRDMVQGSIRVCRVGCAHWGLPWTLGATLTTKGYSARRS
jgi:hypothetical protein